MKVKWALTNTFQLSEALCHPNYQVLCFNLKPLSSATRYQQDIDHHRGSQRNRAEGLSVNTFNRGDLHHLSCQDLQIKQVTSSKTQQVAELLSHRFP